MLQYLFTMSGGILWCDYVFIKVYSYYGMSRGRVYETSINFNVIERVFKIRFAELLYFSSDIIKDNYYFLLQREESDEGKKESKKRKEKGEVSDFY